MESWMYSTPARVENKGKGKGKGKGKNEGASSTDGKRRRTESSTAVSSRDIVGLATATAELSLETARTARVQTGLAVTTLLVPECPTLAAVLTAETDSAQPPYSDVLRWARLVVGLSTEEKVSMPHRSVLIEHCKSTATPDQLLGSVLSCSISPTFANNKLIKVQFAVSATLHEVAAAIIGALRELGGEAKYGPPPRSSAERAVRTSLNSFFHQ
ncbi:unnamed protein product [Polarella glacialis]|uniref:Uncharacterized protein n=1 Tax=Polarella glacialis TaxID=89957 RepID=A0A813L2E9_POLGL|nr:unnamed protein product [Polarella glacialis]